MGNMGSSGSNSRRRHGGGGSGRRVHPPATPQPPPPPENAANRFVYPPAATPYHNYPGYYPPPTTTVPMPLPAPYDHHHLPVMDPAWGRYPPPQPPLAPYVEHQKAVTIKNDVNIKKETLRIEADEENLGHFLVSFTFDATVSGSITVLFFAKEGEGCVLTPMKENVLAPVTVNFQQGLGQKFRQPSGTGINFSMFEESELLKAGDMDVYPVAVKAVFEKEKGELSHQLSTVLDGSNETPKFGSTDYQITQAVFEKEKGEFRVKVVKQILFWLNGMRYELHDIYGIGNSVESDLDWNDPGKECVMCLSEPRDTAVLPCHHMCICSGCAKVMRFQTRFQTARCPICRQPVERLVEMKVGPEPEE